MAYVATNDGYKYIHPNGTAGAQTNSVVAVMIDPATGFVIGSAASPLYTQTSSLQTLPDLTKGISLITTATTTTLITATASVKGRAYRMRLDVAGANVLTFTDATGVEKMNFAAAGFRIYDFATRPWFTTATNTAFTVTTTTTAEVNIVLEYTKVA